MAGMQDQSREVEEAEEEVQDFVSIGSRSAAIYWCDKCSKDVTVQSESQGSEVDMVCSECKNGFVEDLEFADFGGSRWRRNGDGGAERPLNERAETSYLRHVARILRLFAQAGQSRTNDQGTEEESNYQSTEEQPDPNSQGQALNSQLPDLNSAGQELGTLAEGAGSVEEEEEAPWDLNTLVTFFFSDNEVHTPTSGLQLDETGVRLESEEEARTDSDTADLRRALNAWDSFQLDEENDADEEWEEVDEEEARDREEVDLTYAEVIGPAEGERRQGLIRSQSGGRPNLGRMMRNFDWHEVIQSLEDDNFNTGFDLGEDYVDDDDAYVGDPEDYVDAAGYEILLEHFAENDNSFRGAPPAAKTAVQHLPSIFIGQKEVDNGKSLCAICKDGVLIGEPVKQLPCLHHYHGDCILPWLSCRNSCPVCRYELPTDDPDYEEQRKQGCLQH
eukprot:Gb_26865 [translate_table: standard]